MIDILSPLTELIKELNSDRPIQFVSFYEVLNDLPNVYIGRKVRKSVLN